MGNPFSDLQKQLNAQKVEAAGFEEVDGPMRCMTAGCDGVASVGLYSEVAKILTWKCPHGHESRLENFEA